MEADRPAPCVPRGGLRSLVYRALLSSAHGLYKAGNGCLFTAAGLLWRDELQAASVDQYRFFNVSAFDVDVGLSPAEQHFYRRFLRDRDRVLLVGSGSGRDLIALHSLGCDVTGLEPIPELVELARQHLERRGISASVQTGLIQTAEIAGPYDAVIFSNCCYSCIQGRQTRVDSLVRVSRQISARGRVIVSYHPAKSQSALGHWLARASARLGGVDWRPEPGDTFARDFQVPGRIRFYRAFEPKEFANECAAAGLTVLTDEPSDEGARFAAAAIGSA